MQWNRIKRLASVTSVFLGLVSITHAALGVELTFGLYASERASELVRQFRPLLDSVEKTASAKLGEPVAIRTRVAPTYEDGVTDLVEGQVDFSRFGPASYIEAKSRESGITIIAMETLHGKKTFRGIICVKEDSPIKSLEQLKGKRFAFGSADSTIGRYLAQDLLVDHGIYGKDLAGYEYLGRHDKVGAAVAAGLFDAGALKEDTFLKLKNGGKPLRELAAMDNVTKPWLARAGLPGNIQAALREALMELEDLSSLQEADGFAEGEDGDYGTIRKAMASSRAFAAHPAQ